jgi:Arc/MetJ family transcription regulator
MRTTITVDDELMAQAIKATGIKERSALIRHALEELLATEAARRLARLGGTLSHMKAPPRRRFEHE